MKTLPGIVILQPLTLGFVFWLSTPRKTGKLPLNAGFITALPLDGSDWFLIEVKPSRPVSPHPPAPSSLERRGWSFKVPFPKEEGFKVRVSVGTGSRFLMVKALNPRTE